jgi:hypothetical protein
MNLVDAIATLTWIKMGIAEEENPLMGFILQNNEIGFVVIKTVLVALSAGLLWRMRILSLARTLIIPVFFIYLYVTVLHSWAAYSIIVGSI